MSHIFQDIHKNKILIVKADRTGNEIACLGGTVWLTQEGDGRDRILTPGDIFQSRIQKDIVIEGMDHSRIRISPLRQAEVINLKPVLA